MVGEGETDLATKKNGPVFFRSPKRHLDKPNIFLFHSHKHRQNELPFSPAIGIHTEIHLAGEYELTDLIYKLPIHIKARPLRTTMSNKTSPSYNSPRYKTPKFSSAAGTPNIHQQQQQTQQQDINSEPPEPTTALYPSPQAFDIVPPLHALLVLLSASQAGNQPTSQQQGLPGEANDPTNPAGAAAGTPSLGPVDPKSLLTGASTVKIRIQKAKNAVDELPDINRTVAEQEEEIAHLEKRIGRLNEVIGDFGRGSEKIIDRF